MSRKDSYRGVQMHCVVCQKPIPVERKWDAVTCSPECTKRRKDFGRSRKDQLECRYCLRPSTPEERARYQAWRRWEKAGQTDDKSAASLLRMNQRLQRKIAELEAANTIRPDTEGYPGTTPVEEEDTGSWDEYQHQKKKGVAS